MTLRFILTGAGAAGPGAAGQVGEAGGGGGGGGGGGKWREAVGDVARVWRGRPQDDGGQ